MMYVCVEHTFMFKHLRSNVHLHDIIIFFFFFKQMENIDDDTTPQITNDKDKHKGIHIYRQTHRNRLVYRYEQ